MWSKLCAKVTSEQTKGKYWCKQVSQLDIFRFDLKFKNLQTKFTTYKLSNISQKNGVFWGISLVNVEK